MCFGWQYRWFTVDAQTGILRYFLPTNNWSASANNITADSQSMISGHCSFDLDAVSTTGLYNAAADSRTSLNHIGGTPRWRWALKNLLNARQLTRVKYYCATVFWFLVLFHSFIHLFLLVCAGAFGRCCYKSK